MYVRYMLTEVELPFSIWWYVEAVLTFSDSCQNHLAQGVRFNAQKVPAGSYYSTPVWLFRCKCAMCKARFEIRTDPKVRP